MMHTLIVLLQFAALMLTSGLAAFLAHALIRQTKWPAWLNLALSFVLAGLVGLATAWLNGDVFTLVAGWSTMTGDQLFTFVVFTWTTAQGWYWIVFKSAPWVRKLEGWPGVLTRKVE